MPADTEPRVVLTIDVEWSCAEVIEDVVRLLEERNLRATFFCTHPGIPLGSHERALHPNYRWHGNSQLARPESATLQHRTEAGLCRQVIGAVRKMYPEAIGARSHCLYFEYDLLKMYAEFGLHYDSSSFLPMVHHLQPAALAKGIVEFPIYYMDEWDLSSQATDFTLEKLELGTGGLKVLDFHPNLVYLNTSIHEHYLESKAFYHDADWLLQHRRPERGARNLFIDVLDYLAKHAGDVSTLAELLAPGSRDGAPSPCRQRLCH